MGFSVSKTIGELTYTISHDDLTGYVAALHEANGLHGLQELTIETGDPWNKPEPGSEASVSRAVEHLSEIGHVVEPGTHSEPGDELADLIRSAPDAKTLLGLWRHNKAKWNSDYNHMADKRKKELEKKK